jgi:hypothetical protein
MSATVIAYIAFALGGVIIGMVIQFLLSRNWISSRDYHIGKNKVKGRGNSQDLELEVDEADQLTKRQQKKADKEKEKQNKELQDEANKQVTEIKKQLKL